MNMNTNENFLSAVRFPFIYLHTEHVHSGSSWPQLTLCHTDKLADDPTSERVKTVEFTRFYEQFLESLDH